MEASDEVIIMGITHQSKQSESATTGLENNKYHKICHKDNFTDQ